MTDDPQEADSAMGAVGGGFISSMFPSLATSGASSTAAEADAAAEAAGSSPYSAAAMAAAAAADAGPTVATRGKCAGLGASFGMLDGARLDADRRRCIELLDRASGALAHVSQVAQVASNLYAPELCVRLCLPLTCIPTCTLASRATVGMRRTCLRATCVLTRQWFRCW